jgi:hypothetical protein
LHLLSSHPISIAEASKGLDAFLDSEFKQFSVSETESYIQIKKLPVIARSLREDWVTDEEPGADACFVEVYARLEVHMPPCFLGANLNEGLRKAIAVVLLRHDTALKCMPLTFKNLKPCGSLGAVVSVSPYVHFLAEFRCVGFAPEVGQRLAGRINPIQTDTGLGGLILNEFTGRMPKITAPGLKFHQDEKAWRYQGKSLMKDERVWFVVNSTKIHNDLFDFLGTWEYNANKEGSDDADAVQTVRPKKRKSIVAAEHVVDADIESEAAQPPKKKKKKKKERETPERAPQLPLVEEAHSDGKKKRKSRKTT